MPRLHLILACVLCAAMATSAQAQSYPYGYAQLPQGMPQGPDAQMYQGTYPPAAQYHSAVPAPPPVKLPPGVKAENGLLYYNGKAYGDVNPQSAAQFNPYQNNPYQAGGYPNQPVAYQEGVASPMPQAGPQSVMEPGGMTMQGQPAMMPGYGGQCSSGCANGDCNGSCVTAATATPAAPIAMKAAAGGRAAIPVNSLAACGVCPASWATTGPSAPTLWR